MTQDLYNSLLERIEKAIPSVPDWETALCHVNLCSQSQCAYCQRVMAAHDAMKILKKVKVSDDRQK